MLWKRILTALILVALLGVVLLWLPEPLAIGALALLVLAGASEWAKFAGLASYPGRLGYMLVCAVVMTALWVATAAPGGLETLLWLTLGWWVLAFLWLSLRPGWGNRWLAGAAGLCALAPCGSPRRASTSPASTALPTCCFRS